MSVKSKLITKEYLESFFKEQAVEESIKSLIALVDEKFSDEYDYSFESKDVEKFFNILEIYFEFYDSFGDNTIKDRFEKASLIIQEKGFSPENLFMSIEFNAIQVLLNKFHSKQISKKIFYEQVKKLTPLELNWQQLFLQLPTSRLGLLPS